MQFPSLTPIGASELYAGYNSNGTSGVYTTPITTGYTQEVTSDFDVILVDPDVSASPQSPSTTATSQPSTQSSIGALIVATPASQYTVTFSGNGSTGGSMANETASGATNLTANAFTKTGYSFAGWNTVATGGGTSYANGASYPFTASTTLYAQWTQSTGAIALVSGLDLVDESGDHRSHRRHERAERRLQCQRAARDGAGLRTQLLWRGGHQRHWDRHVDRTR
jgi:hypothetical protein